MTRNIRVGIIWMALSLAAFIFFGAPGVAVTAISFAFVQLL